MNDCTLAVDASINTANSVLSEVAEGAGRCHRAQRQATARAAPPCTLPRGRAPGGGGGPLLGGHRGGGAGAGGPRPPGRAGGGPAAARLFHCLAPTN
jgi:hypothetical protein